MSSTTYPRATATDATGAHPTRTHAIRAIAVKDFTAVRRSKGVLLPMLIVPFLLLVVLPLAVGIAARNAHPPDVSSMLRALPGGLARPILLLPRRERLLVLVDGYLVAPLFLIVPLMLAAVLAADAFAGEKERKTLESLLHQPVPDRDLFLAKLLGAFVPAVAISWVGFACFAAVVNATAWPIAHHLIVPTKLWAVVIFWVAPAVAALGLGVMVRVSARASSTQEANQLGGAVILPLIFLAVGQSTGLLLVTLPAAIGIGAVVWAVALFLVGRGAQRFRRDRIARTI
ncbi:MAG: ABC transporter permease subunit [Acidimicrobiia bacterium]|nr:ABC transporter permease subunit [Acidimicrobiia bacterium]